MQRAECDYSTVHNGKDKDSTKVAAKGWTKKMLHNSWAVTPHAFKPSTQNERQPDFYETKASLPTEVVPG